MTPRELVEKTKAICSKIQQYVRRHNDAAKGRIVAAVDPFAESFGDPAAANMAHIIVLAVNTAAGVDTESTHG